MPDPAAPSPPAEDCPELAPDVRAGLAVLEPDAPGLSGVPVRDAPAIALPPRRLPLRRPPPGGPELDARADPRPPRPDVRVVDMAGGAAARQAVRCAHASPTVYRFTPLWWAPTR